MADNFPIREELTNRSRADIKALLPTSDPYNVTSILNAIAVSDSNRAREIYDALNTIIKNTFAFSAEDQALLDQAADWGLFLTAATQAAGNVIFTGIAGTVIPINTEAQSSNTEVYTTDVSKTISLNTNNIPASGLTSSGVTATALFNSPHGLGTGMVVTIAGANEADYNGVFEITVVSDVAFQYTLAVATTSPATGTITYSFTGVVVPITSVNTGSATNVLGGAVIALSQTIAGIDSTIYTQFSGIDGGANTETPASLQERLVLKKSNPSTPFNDIEIELQAREVSGVTRVWVIDANEVNTSQVASTVAAEGSGFNVVTFSTDHGLYSGMTIVVSGANEAEFNGEFNCLVINDTTIAYFVSGNTGSATGAVTVSYSNVQPGQVRVFFVRDGDLTITPSSQEIQDVKDSILEIKPAHTSDDDVIVEGPTLKAVDFTFTTLTPDTTGLRSSISQNLEDLFFLSSPGATITQDAYRNAIQNSFDIETNQGISEFELSTPTGSITSVYNEIISLGTVSYSF